MKSLLSKISTNENVKAYYATCEYECSTNCTSVCGGCGYACQGECKDNCKAFCKHHVLW